MQPRRIKSYSCSWWISVTATNRPVRLCSHGKWPRMEFSPPNKHISWFSVLLSFGATSAPFNVSPMFRWVFCALGKEEKWQTRSTQFSLHSFASAASTSLGIWINWVHLPHIERQNVASRGLEYRMRHNLTVMNAMGLFSFANWNGSKRWMIVLRIEFSSKSNKNCFHFFSHSLSLSFRFW